MPAVLDSPASTETFTPPSVAVGDIVKWLDPGSQNKWQPAVVQRVTNDVNLGVNSLGLSVIPTLESGKTDFIQSKLCVLHVLDPRINEGNRAQFGAWDLTDGEKARRREMNELRELVNRKARKE